MAARGYVHSARAFGRTLSSVGTDKLDPVFRVPRTLNGRRVCRLLAIESSPDKAVARSMATNVNSLIGKRDLGTKSAKQPRLQSSYEEAVVALNSLQSNAETLRKSLQHRNESRKYNIPFMINYLQRAGLSLDDVDRLQVIHVTGTKGKGSTCAFADSILRQYGYKTGVFSSPHLIEVRERIRINGRPIDRDLFSSCFWDVFDKLQSTKDSSHEQSMPHYFSFLTVMSLYVFVREKVDVALLEVGIGGQYDSTNLVRSPVVCGISSLDLDHTSLLGNTLEDIAWHKAGIFKTGSKAITVPQPESALQVILDRSHEMQCPVSIAAPLKAEELSPSHDLHLGIAGDKQCHNAALAVQLCKVWLHQREQGKEGEKAVNGGGDENGDVTEAMATSIDTIPVIHSSGLTQHMITGLVQCQWPGRTQTVHTPGVTFYLDGAHTTDSVQQCVDWFQDVADKERKRFKGKVHRGLVFNMTGDRPVSCLLKKLKDCGFDRAAFCPNVVSTIASKNIPDQFNRTAETDTVLKRIRSNRQAWDQLFNEPQSTEIQYSSASEENGSGNGSSVKKHSPRRKEASAELHSIDGGGCDDSGKTNGHSHKGNGVGGGCKEHSSVSLDGLQQKQQHQQLQQQQHEKCQSGTFPCIASALQWASAGNSDSDADDSGRGLSLEVNGSVWVVSEGEGGGEGKDVNENEEGGDVLVQVLVTGSLHLVGGVLELLTPHMND